MGAFPKYQPMWKGEGFLGNSEEGIGKKSVALATESPRLGGAEAPPFGKGGFGLRLGFHPVTIPGTGGAVTNRRRFPCEIVRGHCPLAVT